MQLDSEYKNWISELISPQAGDQLNTIEYAIGSQLVNQLDISTKFIEK